MSNGKTVQATSKMKGSAKMFKGLSLGFLGAVPINNIYAAELGGQQVHEQQDQHLLLQKDVCDLLRMAKDGNVDIKAAFSAKLQQYDKTKRDTLTKLYDGLIFPIFSGDFENIDCHSFHSVVILGKFGEKAREEISYYKYQKIFNVYFDFYNNCPQLWNLSYAEDLVEFFAGQDHDGSLAMAFFWTLHNNAHKINLIHKSYFFVRQRCEAVNEFEKIVAPYALLWRKERAERMKKLCNLFIELSKDDVSRGIMPQNMLENCPSINEISDGSILSE